MAGGKHQPIPVDPSGILRIEGEAIEALKKLGITFYDPTPGELKQWRDLGLKVWPKLRSQCNEEILHLVLGAQNRTYPTFK